MGGYGSTRWLGRERKPLVERSDVLDIAEAIKGELSCLQVKAVESGSPFTLILRGQTFRLQCNSIVLKSGFKRWLFICPTQGCGRKIQKLYRPWDLDKFACRSCHGLVYRKSRNSRKKTKWYTEWEMLIGSNIEKLKRYL